MHRGQCRGAGHVDGHCRAFQTQGECHPSDGDACGCAEVAVRLAAGSDHTLVFTADNPCVHSGPAAPESVGVDAGLFKSLPTRFQHHPLSWVHQARFYRRNAEEARVEPLNALNKRAAQVGCILSLRVSDSTTP